jgi:hypothetical protein
MYECRCDERLKTKVEESTRLVSTVFVYYESISEFLFYFIMNRENEG